MQSQEPTVHLPLSGLARLCSRCSLKTRLIAMAVGLFVAFIWVLVFFSLTVLEKKFQQVLAAEQLASTQRLAADLDAKLNERLQTLVKVAENLPGELRPTVLDPFLQQLGATPLMFPGGVVVIGTDGKAIADFPVAPGRRGTYYNDRDYFRNVIGTRSAYIGRPVIGRVLKRPVMTMAVPVFDNTGNVRAVLTGITDLSAPNFLKAVSEPSMAGKGELFVFSLYDGTIIAATDSKLTMTSAMKRGRNVLFERIAGGFEGSDIGVNTQGIEKLYSAIRVPTANWAVVAALPTEVAFSAVSAMQKYVYVAAGVMTLIAVLLIRLAARRMLAPLDAAGAAMRRMTEGQTPLAALPVERDDEIGQLIGNFNLLVAERNRAEQAQMNLNRALRLLSNCNMALVHAEREQSLLDEICRLVVTSGGYHMAWVGYAEHDADKTVRPVSSFGDTNAYLGRAPISWGEGVYGRGPAGHAIRTREAQVNADFRQNVDLAPWREAAAASGFRSSIALPLIAQGSAFGVLSIYSPDADSFSEDEVRLLRELANDLAFGIDTLRIRLEREAAEEKLAFLAHHDPLTSLPNRVLLRDRFDRALASAAHSHTGVALLTLDLDNFKRVNDSLGHDVGDQLLLRVVQRLHHCIRDTDTISRQGGDEFVILLTAVSDSSLASRVAQAILDAMAEPFEIGNHTITTSFSIGISVYPNDGHDFDTLLKNADTALYHAKDNGRDTYHFFANTMNVDALARIQLHANLRKAVKDGEFLLHYQPQVDIASGATIGVEALIRWQHQGELVPPSRFIPLAEETGLIVRIGEWVLNEACRQARAWMDAGLAPLVVAVNLSAHQFKRGNVLASVTEALERSGLPAAHLELELTESILLQDTTEVVETLRKLKKLGVHLSIDDFGTGYSSMSYLKQLSVDKLKIDQSFVRDLATDPDDAAIVKAIIQLGQALQLCVVAEGVETEDQLSFLRRYGCDQAQGYLISRPVAAEEITAMSAVP